MRRDRSATLAERRLAALAEPPAAPVRLVPRPPVVATSPIAIDEAMRTAVGCHAAGRLNEAERIYRWVLSQRPDHADALHWLGVVAFLAGRADEAIGLIGRAIAIKPDHADALRNLAFALHKARRVDEAIVACRRTIELVPDWPEPHHMLGLGLLTLGDYVHGWPESGFGMDVASTPQFSGLPGSRWRGEPLRGDWIALVCEQGFGDIFQFVRYAPLVRARGGRVALVCEDALIPILSTVAGVERIVSWDEPIPDCRYKVDLMSLPAIVGTTLATIPTQFPYIHPDPHLVQAWGERVAGTSSGFRIGIVWHGSLGCLGDPHRYRSIPLRCFEPLARVPGVRLISLQVGSGVEQLQDARFPIIDLGPALTETPGAFMDSAAVVANLDLVISCDTGFAHFAGAMGARVWTALPYWPCWRWLIDRDDSPWYPTMLLFRQETPGDWDSVFRRMAEALIRETILKRS